MSSDIMQSGRKEGFRSKGCLLVFAHHLSMTGGWTKSPLNDDDSEETPQIAAMGLCAGAVRSPRVFITYS